MFVFQEQEAASYEIRKRKEEVVSLYCSFYKPLK